MKKINKTVLLVIVALFATAGIARAAVANYRTHLKGDNEVPPTGVVIETNAQGQAIFQLSPDGSELSYKLIVANIENVFQAHIHIGAPGSNGPIAVWLYPSTTPMAGPFGQGRIQGPIAEGTITSANLVNQAATGITTVAQLIAAIEAGNAYVNVHTNDGVAPANTGPGDFPGGEIRGPIGGHDH
ncbi:MAG TPA: CHRD domain-containing protein [Anaerolineales bacterium]|nr:CHRD domain-containing protein [Anaerolineales bacterium]